MSMISRLFILLFLAALILVCMGGIVWFHKENKITATAMSCGNKDGQERIMCFDQVFNRYLKQEGVEKAFDYLLTIYNAYPEVPTTCHEWMHRIGEADYARYKKSEAIDVREETAYCSYGYFHGFIGAMAREVGLQGAKAFCEQIPADGTANTQLQFNNCIHGMGHSVATLMLESDASWGNAQKIIKNGALACEELYEGTFRGICYDGMFHELHLALWSEDYGLTNEIVSAQDDLFYYCHNLSGLLLESCVYDFAALWPYVYGDDKEKAMDAMLHILLSSSENAEKPLKNLGRSFIEEDMKTHEYASSVSACEKVPQVLYRACLEGLATGFVEHGKSGEMHKEGFSFCRTYYTEEKQHMCFLSMIKALSWNYAPGALVSACKELSAVERAGTDCAL